MARLKLFSFISFLLSITVSNVECSKRIVGGEETSIEQRPYIASLQISKAIITHKCAASIINTRTLLTGARCHPGADLPFYYARVGSLYWNSGGQFLKVGSFIAHPDYNSSTMDYDVAIVSFSGGAQVILGPNAAVMPLPSAQGNNPIPGNQVFMAGWGVTHSSATSISPTLRDIKLPFVSDSICFQSYDSLTPRQICFGGSSLGNQSACVGDYGGPAVMNGIQYGIFSGTKDCEAPGVPGVYCKVTAVRDWITQWTGI